MVLHQNVTNLKTIKTFETLEHRFKEIHGDKYDYSAAVYLNYSTKIDIICRKHNHLFKQTPDSHISGAGCKKCAIENNHELSKDTFETFVRKATNTHGGKYNYNRVVYIDTYTKVSIFCNKHNKYFTQTPNAHLQGQGCSECSKTKKITRDEFLSKSSIIHNNKYDYSLVNYKNITSKVDIICIKHGVFTQDPWNHMCGRGCRKCSQEATLFDKYKDRKTYLYYILINKHFYKIGLTQKDIHNRFSQDIKKSGIEIEVLDIFEYTDGIEALQIEQLILRETERLSISKQESPIRVGWTEIRCADISDVVYKYVR